MSRIPLLARAVLRCSSLVVPSDRREAWQAEWRAELEHASIEADRRGESRGRTRRRLAIRAAGSLPDALWLRSRLAGRGWRALGDAARSLRRRPGFALAVAGTLALGIGSSTAVFTLVDGLLLRPLPFREPEQLVSVLGAGRAQTVDLDVIRAWQDEERVFSEVHPYVPRSVILTGAGEARRDLAWRVAPGFLEMLGIAPALGRSLTPGDAVPGGGRVVLLGDEVWREAFAGDADVVGRTVELDGEPYTVVGVLPPTLRRLPFGRVSLIVPLSDPPPDTSLAVLARLAPGVGFDAAQARVDDLALALERERPREGRWQVVLRTVERRLGDEITNGFWTLSAAVLCLLLTACANAAGLLLLRGIRRRPEFALRAALGGSRGALFGQVLAESALLAAAAGALGTLLAWLAVAGMLRLLPASLVGFSYTPVGLDGRVLTFAMVVTALVALLFGVAPAMRTATRSSPRAAGRAATASREEVRLRGAVQVGQVALAMVLLAGAVLFGRSFLRLSAEPLGYEPDRVVELQLVSLDALRGDTTRSAALAATLDERLRALPGVTAVARHSGMGIRIGYRFETDDGNVLESEEGLVPYLSVTPGYFDAMGIRILEGRDFGAGDDAGSPAVILDRDLAERLWPDGSAVGRTVRFRSEPPMTVVGVSEDVKLEGPREPLGPWVMFHPADAGALRSGINVVRTEDDPRRLVPAVRRLLAELDPDQPIATLRTGREAVGESVADPRFLLVTVAAFAGMALLLAAVGIYGLVSFGVAQRTREIGVRMALGAGSARVVNEVVRSGLLLCVTGLALGLGAALSLSRFVSALLFGVSPLDPLALALASGLLLGACVLALAIPALRATRVDPSDALRID